MPRGLWFGRGGVGWAISIGGTVFGFGRDGAVERIGATCGLLRLPMKVGGYGGRETVCGLHGGLSDGTLDSTERLNNDVGQ